jgi:tetratricopeptide (TPR) repeat protein
MKSYPNKKWLTEYKNLTNSLATAKNKKETIFYLLKSAEEISGYYMWPKIVDKYAELGFTYKAEKELYKITLAAFKMTDRYKKGDLLLDCAKLYSKFGQEDIAKSLFYNALEIMESLYDPQQILDLSFKFKVPYTSWGEKLLDRLWLIATKLPTKKAFYVVENIASQLIEMGEIDNGIIYIIKFKEFITEDYKDDYKFSFNTLLKKAAIKNIEIGDTDRALQFTGEINDGYALENIAVKFTEHGEPEIAFIIAEKIESDCLGNAIPSKFSECGYFEKALNMVLRMDEDYIFSLYNEILNNDNVTLEQIKKIEHKIPEIGKADLAVEYIKRGDIESAEKIMNSFEKESYNRIRSVAALSRAYAEKGEKEKAEQFCNEVLNNKYTYYNVVIDIIDTYILLDQKENAIKWIEKHITEDFFLSCGNISIILKYIRICSKSDVNKRMEKIINQLTQGLNDLEIAVYFISALWQQGWEKEARAALTLLIEKTRKMNECSTDNGRITYYAELKVYRLAEKLIENKLSELFNEFFNDLLESAMFNRENSGYSRPNALIVFSGLV